ncbi:MAG: hemerythrin [Clostridiales bacterium]|jgi:hemerythrin|nr:hemerythrin [Clostridiales bacterium]MDK2933257.1 hemerythrin [Clostridiales bacterium]
MNEPWQWNEQLESGVQEIDMQHKELLHRVNQFMQAVNDGKREEVVKETVSFLEQYVREHFTAEEKLQQESNYPGYVHHKELHDKFINDLHKLQSRLKGQGITPEVLFTLSRTVSLWLVEHIGMADMTFAEFLKNNKI